MHTLLLVMACVAADPKPLVVVPWVVVKSADEAAELPKDVANLRVVIRDHRDQTILAAVLKHAPTITHLDLYHPDNGVPTSIGLLTQFSKLEGLQFTGDANLDDKTFAVLGKLAQLKSLRMKLP